MTKALVDAGWLLGNVFLLKFEDRVDGDAIVWFDKVDSDVCASYLETLLKLPELADPGQNIWNVNSCRLMF